MNKKMKQPLRITDEHKALRELRLSKGLSLDEASIPLGIKSKGLGHVENGRVKLTKEKIEKMKNNGCLAMLAFFGSITVVFILLKLFVFKG